MDDCLSSPHQLYLTGSLLSIQIYFKKSAFNEQAHHKVLYRVTEGINVEKKRVTRTRMDKGYLIVVILLFNKVVDEPSLLWNWILMERTDLQGEVATSFYFKTRHKFRSGDSIVTHNNKNLERRMASLIVT